MIAGTLRAGVLAQGAELCSLCLPDLGEVIWQAAPVWPRHAPNLFPIVGRLVGDRLRLGQKSFQLGQHGFARDRRFIWTSREDTSCRLELRDDDATRAVFPFAFRLEVGYALAPWGLTVSYRVENPGTETLIFSIGAHPAFAWPLRVGAGKTNYSLAFAKPELAPIRRLRSGLLLAERFASPVEGQTLRLDEALFGADAIIMDSLASDSVRYVGRDGAGIELAWSGFRELGVWSRPGGDFVCIEPWAGHASPEAFDGDFADKPGVIRLEPGEFREFSLQVRTLTG